MWKSLLRIIAAAAVLAPTWALAVESYRVVVLPFRVHSQQDLSRLETEIPVVIEKGLRKQGAEILKPETLPETPAAAESGLTMGALHVRQFGIRYGIDYVVWGSLTSIGERYSLDAKMLASFGKQPPQVFFKEGQRLETLERTLQDLTRDIGLKLFRRQKVTAVTVEGNQRIEADAILRVIQTVPGTVFQAKELSEDLKRVYKMGYFDDVRIEAEDGTEGKSVVFKVEEKPTIRKISFENNDVYDDKEILKNVTLNTGSILNIFKINENIKRIEDLYKEKNYHNIKVTYKIEALENNQADLEFTIEEGRKLLIRNIVFKGNSRFDDDELKELMKSNEKGFFSWITSSGELNREDLDQDMGRIQAFYHNNGYIDAKVDKPEVKFEEDRISIIVKLKEGPQYTVGKVDLAGDLILDEKLMLAGLKIRQEAHYNQETIRNDILALTDLYADRGYAYAKVIPRRDRDDEKLQVNIIYTITKGKPVYFEKILITGNTKTRDKVIRRELGIYEQELFKGSRLKRGVRNLHRLDFFEDVKVDTVKGSADDQMVLKLEVQEKATGAFSFGGGYSSVEDLFAVVSLTERNFLGLGQTAQLKAQVGGTTNKYDLKYTEPWLFDIPLSAGIDLYKWERDYDEYTKDAVGGGLRFSYPVANYTRFYLGYIYDISDLQDVQTTAADSIKEMEGENTTSSAYSSLRYDSRNRIFNPTEGGDHNIRVEYAGLGGDVGFTKVTADVGFYIPLFWSVTGFAHARGGYVRGTEGKKLPDWEKFYLGGINSLRGYDWREVGVQTTNSAGLESTEGGEKVAQFNFEVIFPLIKDAGVMGVLFFDAGNVWDQDTSADLGDLKQGIGYGLRWYSPVGPIRLEQGFKLNPDEGEDSGGKWEFTMGTSF